MFERKNNYKNKEERKSVESSISYKKKGKSSSGSSNDSDSNSNNKKDAGHFKYRIGGQLGDYIVKWNKFNKF